MTGSKYTVEHRNFEIGVVSDQSRSRSERGNLLNSETVAFQVDTSEPGYSPDPSSRVGSGVQTRSGLPPSLQTQCEAGLGK